MINDHETRRELKTQLIMQINFLSHEDSKAKRTMYTKIHNVEIMIGRETDEINKKYFESLLHNYQKKFRKPMRGSEFVSNSIDLLYYYLPKIGLKRSNI